MCGGEGCSVFRRGKLIVILHTCTNSSPPDACGGCQQREICNRPLPRGGGRNGLPLSISFYMCGGEGCSVFRRGKLIIILHMCTNSSPPDACGQCQQRQLCNRPLPRGGGRNGLPPSRSFSMGVHMYTQSILICYTS